MITVAKRVLVVDDEPSIVRSVKRVLEKEGYEVLTASCGEECLDTLGHERVDLVLLDIIMPGITPMELIKKARNMRLAGLKFIYVSAVPFTEEDTNAMIEDSQVQDFIRKPFDNLELVCRVRKAIG